MHRYVIEGVSNKRLLGLGNFPHHSNMANIFQYKMARNENSFDTFSKPLQMLSIFNKHFSTPFMDFCSSTQCRTCTRHLVQTLQSIQFVLTNYKQRDLVSDHALPGINYYSLIIHCCCQEYKAKQGIIVITEQAYVITKFDYNIETIFFSIQVLIPMMQQHLLQLVPLFLYWSYQQQLLLLQVQPTFTETGDLSIAWSFLWMMKEILLLRHFNCFR